MDELTAYDDTQWLFEEEDSEMEVAIYSALIDTVPVDIINIIAGYAREVVYLPPPPLIRQYGHME